MIVKTDGSSNDKDTTTYGFVVKKDGQEIYSDDGEINYKEDTSCVGEYIAVIKALKWASKRNKSVQIKTDCQLVFEQIKGISQVRAEYLKELCKKAKRLIEETESSIVWIRRRENDEAGKLAKDKLIECR